MDAHPGHHDPSAHHDPAAVRADIKHAQAHQGPGAHMVGTAFGEVIEDEAKKIWGALRGRNLPGGDTAHDIAVTAKAIIEAVPGGDALARFGAHLGAAELVANVLKFIPNDMMTPQRKAIVNTVVQNALAGIAVGGLDAIHDLDARLEGAATQVLMVETSGDVAKSRLLRPNMVDDTAVHLSRMNPDGTRQRSRTGEYLTVCRAFRLKQDIQRRLHPGKPERTRRGKDGKEEVIPAQAGEILELEPDLLAHIGTDDVLCPECFSFAQGVLPETAAHAEHHAPGDVFLHAINPHSRAVIEAWIRTKESWLDERLGGDFLKDLRREGMDVQIFDETCAKIAIQPGGTLTHDDIQYLKETIERLGPGRLNADNTVIYWLSLGWFNLRSATRGWGMSIGVITTLFIAAVVLLGGTTLLVGGAVGIGIGRMCLDQAIIYGQLFIDGVLS